jgi:hypothetical protein
MAIFRGQWSAERRRTGRKRVASRCKLPKIGETVGIGIVGGFAAGERRRETQFAPLGVSLGEARSASGLFPGTG